MRGTFFQIRCNIWHEERYVDRKILLNSFSFENIFVVVGICVKNLPQNISSKFSGQGSTIFFQSEAGQVRQRWQFCKAGQAGAASFLRAGAGRGRVCIPGMVYNRENNEITINFVGRQLMTWRTLLRSCWNTSMCWATSPPRTTKH